MTNSRRFSSRSSEALTFVAIAAAVLVVDQITKRIVFSTLPYIGNPIIIPGLLRLRFDQNEHGAFGLFGSSPLLLIVMAVIVLAIFWYSFADAAAESKVVRIGFGLILGGAVSNIVDRLHLAYVIDFIDFYGIWPFVFNVADACITIGVILLVLRSLAARRHA